MERLPTQSRMGLSFLVNCIDQTGNHSLITSRPLPSLSHHLNLRSALPPPLINQDAVGQRTEYWRMEDALVEKAAKLLTSKVRGKKKRAWEKKKKRGEGKDGR